MKAFPTHIVSGQSMAPYFRPGDSLHIRPIAFEKVRPGDVVVFRRPSAAGGSTRVVHRVLAVLPGGLVTRGDGNPHRDEELVTPENLQGSVWELERKGRRWKVLGGSAGLFAAGLARFGKHVGMRTARAASAPYRLLRRSGLVRLAWQPRLRALTLTTPDGPLVKYLHGNRTVARWWPDSGRFECRKPYDLVVTLPPHPNPRQPLS